MRSAHLYAWWAVGFAGCCALAIGAGLIIIAGAGAPQLGDFGVGLIGGGLLVCIISVWWLNREVRRRS